MPNYTTTHFKMEAVEQSKSNYHIPLSPFPLFREKLHSRANIVN